MSHQSRLLQKQRRLHCNVLMCSLPMSSDKYINQSWKFISAYCKGVTNNAATGTWAIRKQKQHWQVSNTAMMSINTVLQRDLAWQFFLKFQSKNLATLKWHGNDLGDMFLGIFWTAGFKFEVSLSQKIAISVSKSGLVQFFLPFFARPESDQLIWQKTGPDWLKMV